MARGDGRCLSHSGQGKPLWRGHLSEDRINGENEKFDDLGKQHSRPRVQEEQMSKGRKELGVFKEKHEHFKVLLHFCYSSLLAGFPASALTTVTSLSNNQELKKKTNKLKLDHVISQITALQWFPTSLKKKKKKGQTPHVAFQGHPRPAGLAYLV